MAESTTCPPAGRARADRGLLRRSGGALLTALLLVAVYYVGGAFWVSTIDDDTAFGREIEVPAGGARSVAVAAALIDREVNQHGWTANNPFFQPGSLLDNMPHYQMGIMGGLSRFALQLNDRIGRARGTSPVDGDLDAAAGRLRYPGNIWLFDLSASLAPTTSSERSYREGLEALERYNARLADGDAVFDRRADNLLDTLETFATDIGGLSANIDAELTNRPWLDVTADDVYYTNKGRLYAYYIVLRGLGADFKDVLDERRLNAVWAQMLESFRSAAELRPWVVLNGAPDAALMPSHLASQGFYLMRARTQLREVAGVLLR